MIGLCGLGIERGFWRLESYQGNFAADSFRDVHIY